MPLFPGKLPQGFVKITDAKLEQVFPVLFKYYDTHPLGSITLSNVGDRKLEKSRGAPGRYRATWMPRS